MQVSILPEDLKIGKFKTLQLYNYRTTQDIRKTKINLSQNTISFLRKGTKEVYGDDKTVQIGNDHFVIMKSGNCLMTENVSDSFQVYNSILLFFSNEEVFRFLEKHDQKSISTKNHKSFYIFEYDNYVENFVRSLEQILKLPKQTQGSILKNKFEEIMLYLIHKNKVNFLSSLVQNEDDKISRLRNIVENNKHTKLNLDELAFLSNMSVSTFKRAFFKLYKSTPMKWFNEQRLNHVAFMLRTNDNLPIELFEDAGYENFSNFVQAFKKKFGVTPKQYQVQK